MNPIAIILIVIVLFAIFKHKGKSKGSGSKHTEKTAKSSSRAITTVEYDYDAIQELNAAEKLPESKRAEVFERVLLKEKKQYDLFRLFRLAQYYQRIGKNDKSWSIYNQALMLSAQKNHGEDEALIRGEMASQLESEGKYVQALESMIVSYFLTDQKKSSFDRKSFTSKAKRLTDSAGFSKESVQEIADILEKHIRKGGRNYDGLISDFRAYIKKRS